MSTFSILGLLAIVLAALSGAVAALRRSPPPSEGWPLEQFHTRNPRSGKEKR